MNKNDNKQNTSKIPLEKKQQSRANTISKKTEQPLEHGGPKGLEPTRYGDWERKGRCIDF